MKMHNQIDKTINDNTLLHLGLWLKKNKKLKNRNIYLNRQIINLKYKHPMKKPRVAVTSKRENKLKLNVLAEV